jgi:hypothetical protein
MLQHFANGIERLACHFERGEAISSFIEARLLHSGGIARYDAVRFEFLKCFILEFLIYRRKEFREMRILMCAMVGGFIGRILSHHQILQSG